LSGEIFELPRDEMQIMHEEPGHLKVLEDKGAFHALDTAVTPELRQEGIVRDFNRYVQDQRRAMNLAVSDRIEVRYSAPPHIVEVLTVHQEFLRAELLADRIEPAGAGPAAPRFRLAGEEVSVSIRRAQTS
jgi:isoleucyl-tRNA synthetase